MAQEADLRAMPGSPSSTVGPVSHPLAKMESA